LRLAAALAAGVLLLAACQGRPGGGLVRIVPKTAGAPVPSASPAAGALLTAPVNRPRISIDPKYTVLQVLDENLDRDPDQEQIIAARDLTEVGSPVHLIVVDADTARGTYYFQSWDTDTSARDSRVFSLSARDLVGDHSLQIVASGMNDAGKLTLDVYKLLPPAPGRGLAYKPICQLVADEITIDETDRPDSYSTDIKPGAAFPITAFFRDPESQNVTDLLRVRYTWNAAEGRYVPGSPEKIPGEEVRQAQLKSLFASSGERAFEQFISGSWVQVQPGTPGKSRDTILSIIDFDPVNRKISLSSGNTEEVYLWRESHRTIYNSLLAIGENETVLQIQLLRTFYVTVTDTNAITVTIRGVDTDQTSTVKYVRVDDEIRQRLLDRPDSQATLSTMSLSGRYVGSRGMIIDFQSPRIDWRDSDGLRTGTYILFTLDGATILSARFGATPEEDGHVASWIVDYAEKKDAVSITRTLKLTPVQLTVAGYQEGNGDPLSLLQYEDLRKS
jgi:hypothetical protein